MTGPLSEINVFDTTNRRFLKIRNRQKTSVSNWIVTKTSRLSECVERNGLLYSSTLIYRTPWRRGGESVLFPSRELLSSRLLAQ